MLSFRHLLKHAQHHHTSLAEYALAYQPVGSTPAYQMVWDYLIDVVLSAKPEHQDRLLGGLHTLLYDNRDADYAYVCLSAGCEVGVHISDVDFCLEPEGEAPICCPRSFMLEALSGLISSHRANTR